MSDATAKIKIDIDPSGAVSGAKQVNAALASIGNQGKSTSAANDNLASTFGRVNSNMGKASKSARDLSGNLDRTKSSTNSLSSAFGTLKGAMGAVLAVGIVAYFKDAADAAGLMDAKLKLAVSGWGDYNRAQTDVQRISQQTRSEITSTAVLYGKLASTGAVLNASQTQVARATETVTKAMKVGGAGAVEMEQGVLQLGQALGSGKLGGDEFSSLMESSPRLMKLFADSIGKPVGALKQLASEGKLTSDVLFKALTDPKFTAKLDAEAKQLPKTFGDSFTAVSNLATVTFGAFNEGGQFSQSLFSFADQGSDNMKRIADAARDAGANIRDSFSGLSNIFDPLTANGIGSADAIGVRWRGLKQEIADVLGMIDSVRNFGSGFSVFGGKGSGALIESGMLPTARPQTVDSRGQFLEGAARSRQQRARGNVIDLIKKRGGANFEAFTGAGVSDQSLIATLNGLPKPKPLTGGTGKLKPPAIEKKEDKKAENAAKRVQERADKFWETLKDQAATAGMLPQAAEEYNKQQELAAILGKQLTADQKTQVASLLEKARVGKFIADADADHRAAALDITNQETLLRMKLSGMSDEQLEVERAILEFRADAIATLGEAFVLSSDEYKKREALLRVDQQRSAELKKQSAELERGLDVAKRYSPLAQMRSDTEDLAKERGALDRAFNNADNGGKISADVYKQTVEALDRATIEVSQRFEQEFADTITDLGDQLGGVLGRAIAGFGKAFDALLAAQRGDLGNAGPLGQIINMLGGDGKGGKNAFGDASTAGAKAFADKLFQGDTWSKPFKGMSDSFADLKSTFTGPNGGFVKGIGKAAGQAAAGAQIGDMTNSVLAPLSKMLGFKTSSTGAQLGGAIGSVGGPVGSVIGSLIGSIGGGLLKKTKKGSASIVLGADGTLDVGALTGNSTKMKDAAKGAGTGVASALQQLAAQLGATITGSPSVSIGLRDGKYRVDTTGQGKTKKSSTVVDFGKDGAEEAIAFAVQEALRDGILGGLSEFSNRVLKTLDVDKAAALASSYESILTDLERYKNPVIGLVNDTVKSLDQLAKQMRSAGATTDELAKVEEYRTLKLNDVLKDQVSGFQSLLDDLNGNSGGVTALSQLTSSLAKFQGYQSDIAAGKTVDQDAFTALAQSIMGNAGDVYATNSSQYQDIVAQLKAATGGAMGNFTNAFNAASSRDSTAAAISDQTNTLAAQQGIANDYLRQIAGAVTSGVPLSSGAGGGANMQVRNGQLRAIY